MGFRWGSEGGQRTPCRVVTRPLRASSCISRRHCRHTPAAVAQGLPDMKRHVIQRMLSPCLLS